jgi:hypothetical protein
MPQIQSSPGRFVPFAGKRPLSKGQIYNKCQKATDKLARHNQRFIQTPSRFHPDCYIRPSPVRQSCPSTAIHLRSKSPLPMNRARTIRVSAKPINFPLQKPSKSLTRKALGERGRAGSSAAHSALALKLTLPKTCHDKFNTQNDSANSANSAPEFRQPEAECSIGVSAGRRRLNRQSRSIPLSKSLQSL